MADKVNVEIQTSTIFKTIAIVAFALLFYFLRDILMILFLAIVIASGVGPFADWLEKKRIPRLLGVLVLYLVIFGLFAFLLSLIVPVVSGELSELTGKLSRFVTQISGVLDKAQGQGINRYFDFLGEIQNILESSSQYLQVLSQSVVGVIVNIFGGILSFFAIIILSFYLSVQKRGIASFLQSIVPERYEDYLIKLWARTEKKVGRWFQAQLLLSLVVGVVVFVGLSLMNVRFALLLGILAMVLELVPTVGPVMSAIPGVALGFLQSPTLGVWVLIFYIVVQQLENHALAPIILGRSLGLNPVTVILALLIGAKLAGILGMVIAVPVATILVEILDDFVQRKESRRASSS